jgi:pimeloyl-ACP methyl ester carboxylesterase
MASSDRSAPPPGVDEVALAVGDLTFTAWAAGPADGPMVLLLHGYPQTRYTWRSQLPALAAAGFRAVAPDQRGYSPGARPLGIDAYTTDQLTGDALALAGLESPDRPIHLVGHDWGGQLAWLTAVDHPERIATLTVLSRPHPAAFARSFTVDPGQAERSKHHRAFDDPATADLLLADGARRLRRMLAGSSVPDADIDGYLDVLGERDAMEAALAWYRAAGRTGGLRLADTPSCPVPTCYLWGDADHSVGRRAAELTAEHVTGPYRLVELPGGGHFLTDDGNSDAVTRELLAHLTA